MVLVLLLFTVGSFSAFTYCAVTPSIPVAAAPLFLALTVLLGMATVVAFNDLRGKSSLF